MNTRSLTKTNISLTSKNNRKNIFSDKNGLKNILPKEKEERHNALVAAGGIAALGALGAVIAYQVKSGHFFSGKNVSNDIKQIMEHNI